VPRFLAEVGQDFCLGAGVFGWEGLGGAVNADGGAAQRSELFDDVGDGQAGLVLDGVRDCQGGEHDSRCTSIDSSRCAKMGRAARSVLDIRNEAFHVCQSSWYLAITSPAGHLCGADVDD
jgi:hypothetical protein